MSDAIKAYVKAQKAMGAVIKNASNLHLKSKYADLGSVLDACQGALHDHGFAVLQPCGKDDHGAYVETVLAHESGESFASRVYLVIGKQDMQGVGSAITYARRYGLMGMAGLAPEDNDGEATKAPKQQPKAEAPAVTAQAISSAIDYLAEADTLADLKTRWDNLPTVIKELPKVIAEKDGNKARLSKANADLGGDTLPY